jgi:hypothetical protein
MDLDGKFLRRLWLWYGWGGWWFVGRRLLRCFVLLSLRDFGVRGRDLQMHMHIGRTTRNVGCNCEYIQYIQTYRVSVLLP